MKEEETMSKAKQYKKLSDNLWKVNFSKASRLNNVILSFANSWEHELTKFWLCYEAKKKGFVFVTEAEFKDGSGIADVYLPEIDWVYEVLCSETKERFEKKKYPVKKIVAVKAGERPEL